MKRNNIVYLLISVFIILLTGCSSTSNTEAADTADSSEDITGHLVIALQDTVEDQEGLANVNWPWGYDDYNIVDNGDNTYDSSGEFTWNDNKYHFNITLEDTGETIKVINYSVY
ncbi:hypothetical protein GLW20_00690 [Virgibacillus halodenitrificans]|nr:hypothetical protein [Virgibacillus halodenitrificans]